MSASGKAAIHMGPDYIEILEVCKNTNFQELQNLFDITQMLVHKHGEILNVKMIQCASPSWTRCSLAHDQAIKWSKAKVRFYSDTVLCLGKWRILQMQLEDGKVKWKTFNKLILTENYMELMENRLSSSGIFSQDLGHWKSSEKSRKTCKNKTLNLKNLKIESFSCRCSMILIGREEEIQTEGKCQDSANMMVEQFEESGHSLFKGVSALGSWNLEDEEHQGDHTHQCGCFEHRTVISNTSLCKSAQYLRSSLTLVGVKILVVTSNEVSSPVKAPRSAPPAAGNSLKFNRTSKHWEQKSNLRDFVKKRH